MLGNEIRHNQNLDNQMPNFKPRLWLLIQNTPITFGLITINFAVYMAMCGSGVSLMEPTGADILNWGGNMRGYTLGGDWWRLITNIFVHIGFIHIALNMVTLFQIGIFLEKFTGKWVYLSTYLATGILASLTSLWWNGERVSAGASGAIFGLFGFFLALLLTELIEKTVRQNLLKNIGLVIIINLGYGMKSGIDNSAHIGGLVSGFAFGFLFYFLITQRKSLVIYSIITLATAASISGAYLNLHQDDTKAFQKVVGLISEQEQKALDVQKKLNSLSGSQNLVQITTIMIPAWENGIQMIAKANILHLNNKQVKVRQDLAVYLNLRLAQTTLFKQYFQGDSSSIKFQFPIVEKKIDSVLNSINTTLSQ